MTYSNCDDDNNDDLTQDDWDKWRLPDDDDDDDDTLDLDQWKE